MANSARPAVADADFYLIEQMLDAEGRRLMSRIRESMEKSVQPARMREAVGWARELLGGNGILLENHVGRFVADAEAIYSYEGTREINTLIVGRAITGRRVRRGSGGGTRRTWPGRGRTTGAARWTARRPWPTDPAGPRPCAGPAAISGPRARGPRRRAMEGRRPGAR
jgi:Acyl-CoA dehydrogenase, C-terminal domain